MLIKITKKKQENKTYIQCVLNYNIYEVTNSLLIRLIVKNLLQTFLLFREGNHPDDYSRLTYRKLLEEVCKFANVLKSKGVKKGDRVAVYMPMILESIITILACTRIGAVHSLVVST